MIDEYLQPEYMNLPVTGTVASHDEVSKLPTSLDVVLRSSVSSASTSSRSIEQINSNITQLCLTLEGVERCAEALGTGFQTELIDVLYPLLVKAESANGRVRRCAVLALRGTARSCGAADLSELLRANADYIVDAVSLRLRHVTRHPEAPSVLGTVLRHSDVDVLPIFHDVLLEVGFISFYRCNVVVTVVEFCTYVIYFCIKLHILYLCFLYVFVHLCFYVLLFLI